MRSFYLTLASFSLFAPISLIATANDHEPPYVEQVDAASFAAKQGDLDSSLELLNKAIADHPKESRAYRVRANVYFARKDYDAALSDLNRFLELTSYQVVGYLDRASLYLAMDDYKKALEDVERALQLEPNSDRAHLLAVTIRAAAQHKVPERLIRLRKKGEKLRR